MPMSFNNNYTWHQDELKEDHRKIYNKNCGETLAEYNYNSDGIVRCLPWK
jgi:hypothetical protein